MKFQQLFCISFFTLSLGLGCAPQAGYNEQASDVASIESFDPTQPEEILDANELPEEGEFAIAENAKTGRRRKTGTRARAVTPGILTDARLSPRELQQARGIRDAFRAYSDNALVVRLVDEARKNLKVKSYIEKRVDPVTKVVTYAFFCYRAVKEALQGSGMVPRYLEGAEARESLEPLRKAKFKNLLKEPRYAEFAALIAANPRMAPLGTIIVYANNPSLDSKNCKGRCPSPAGHIEIKSAEAGLDGYISVSESTRPTYGYAVPTLRVVIGVMYKASLLK